MKRTFKDPIKMDKKNSELDDRLPLFGANDYNIASIQARQKWLQNKFGVDLSSLNHFCENSESYRGNIENFIGTAQVPIGVVGPLKINGDYAVGSFYIPLATTEGVLINSYHRGSRIITKAGGANVKILKHSMHSTIVFKLRSLKEISSFLRWIHVNFSLIKKEAEKTTKFGKLKEIDPVIMGNKVLLKMIYDTQDAMGMNMVTIANEQVVKYVSDHCDIKTFYPRSNYSSDKKVSSHNFIQGKGRSVQADVIIPQDLIRYFETSPEKMLEYYKIQLEASVRAGMHGVNGQIANGVAAFFIATGQDVAQVVNSAVGITMCDLDEDKNLYLSVNLPSVLIGTVGGGTRRTYARTCLELIDCNGSNKSNKFAEIIAGIILAGELSILGALASGTFVKAHQLYGR